MYNEIRSLKTEIMPKIAERLEHVRLTLSLIIMELGYAEGAILSLLLIDILPRNIWLLPLTADMAMAGILVAILNAFCVREKKLKLTDK